MLENLGLFWKKRPEKNIGEKIKERERKYPQEYNIQEGVKEL